MPATDDFDEDQYDFDFDETVFGHIDEVEAQWTASQAPRQSAAPAIAPNAAASSSRQANPASAQAHGRNVIANTQIKPVPHSVSGMAPATFGRTKSGKPRAPAPLNTTPGVTGTGFGWEHGGKRSMEGNLQRNLDAIDERQAYWYGSSQQPAPGQPSGGVQVAAGGNAQGQSRDARGHSRGPSGPIMPIEEESQVLDSHNASDSLRPMPAPAAPLMGRYARATSEEAKAARRAAILQTNTGSTSSTVSSATAMAAPRPVAISNRSFSRSASTGSSILTRPQPMAGPSRLSPIPDMPSSQSSSQHSSGAMLRRTHMELEEVKKREQALVRELAELKARESQAQQHRPAPVPIPPQGQGRRQEEEQEMTMPSATQAAWTANLPVDVDVNDPAAVTKRLAEMRTAMYTAKGAETNVRKQLKDAEDRHKEQQERWEAATAELANRLAQQQRDEKAKLEHVRTEAIFNNHAVYATANKSRPSRAESSQRPQQRHDLRTPMPASPSRRGREDARPLMSSSKGKGKAPAPAPPAQPAFRGFQNAFDGPPPTSNRKNAARYAASSASPVKRTPSQAHLVKREIDDPADDVDVDMGGQEYLPDTTPARTPKKGASQGGGVFHEGGEAEGSQAVDGQDEDGGEVDMELEEVPKRDERAAFLSTLVNHNRPTALHVYHSKPLSHQTTLRRILAYQAPTDKDHTINLAYPHDKIVWNDATSALLATLGEGEVSAERLMAKTARHLEALNEWMLRRILVTRSVTEADLCVILDVLRLMTALARLFPSFASEVVEHNAHDRGKSGGSWGMLCHELYSSDQLLMQTRDIYNKMDEAFNALEAPGGEAIDDRAAHRRHTSGLGRASQELLMNEELKREEAEERADTADWCTREFGCAVADLGEALCLYGRGDEVSEGLIDIILCLTERQQHPTVIRRACEMFRAAATFSSHFRVLTMERPDTISLINRLATYLAFKHRRGSAEELLSADIATIRGLCMLTLADPSAIAIISERSCIVPSLIQVLDHEVRKVWGVNVSGESVVHAVLLLYPALMLLHMFVLPPPFVRSYATFTAGYNQTLYPRLSETVYPESHTRPSDKPLPIRQAITVQRDLDEVKAERQAFLTAQEPIMSALPDADIPRPRTRGLGLGGASQSIAFANGSDIPQPLRLKLKLDDWVRRPEMRHVRHLLVAALAPTAYDELYEEMFVPALDDMEEVGRMKKRGLGAREIFDMLRFAQILASNILEVVYQEPTEVDGLWALYNIEQDEMERMADTYLLDEQAMDGRAGGGQQQQQQQVGGPEGERGGSPTVYTNGQAGPSKANGVNGTDGSHVSRHGTGPTPKSASQRGMASGAVGKSPRRPGWASQRGGAVNGHASGSMSGNGHKAQPVRETEVIQISDDSDA